MRNGKGGKDDLKVQFEVPEGSLRGEVPITMMVRGSGLADPVIEFRPSFFLFNPPARLEIKAGKDLFDDVLLEELRVVHHCKGACYSLGGGC